MDNTHSYNGSLTAEQFLFYEMRIASKMYLEGIKVEDAVEQIKKDNLFQYPTERQVSRLTRACYKRMEALNNEALVRELAYAPNEIAKQINLYAIMRYNRLVWEFMVLVIGENIEIKTLLFLEKTSTLSLQDCKLRTILFPHGVKEQSVKSRVSLCGC